MELVVRLGSPHAGEVEEHRIPLGVADASESGARRANGECVFGITSFQKPLK